MFTPSISQLRIFHCFIRCLGRKQHTQKVHGRELTAGSFTTLCAEFSAVSQQRIVRCHWAGESRTSQGPGMGSTQWLDAEGCLVGIAALGLRLRANL